MALGAAALGRWLVSGWLERRHDRRRRFTADGVIDGAAGFELDAPGSRGALLLHGFGDTPQTLALLGAHLHRQGITVAAPLLPGHGRTLREFARSRGSDWLDAARTELERLRRRRPHLAIIGLSMGAALGALLAAESDDVEAFVALAPYFAAPSTVRRLARHRRWLSILAPYIPTGDPRSIHDPDERERSLAHGIVTARLLAELLTLADAAVRALPRITAPALVVHSRTDNRVAADEVEQVVSRLSSAEVKVVWLDGCGHVITVDRDRDRVFTEASDWLQQHLPVE